MPIKWHKAAICAIFLSHFYYVNVKVKAVTAGWSERGHHDPNLPLGLKWGSGAKTAIKYLS